MILAIICIVAFFAVGYLVLITTQPDSLQLSISILGGLLGVAIVIGIAIYIRLDYVLINIDNIIKNLKEKNEDPTDTKEHDSNN